MIVLHESGYAPKLKRVRFSPDGRTLVTIGEWGDLRLWNRDVANRSRVVQEYYRSDFAFTSDGSSLLYILNNSIRSTNFVGGRDVHIFTIPSETNVHLLALQVSGRAIFLRESRDWPAGRRLECWSWRDGERLWQTEDPIPGIPIAIALSPDGEIMATASTPESIDTLTFSIHLGTDVPSQEIVRPKTTVDIWNLQTGRVRHSMPAADPVTAFAFSPDSRKLAWVSGAEIPVRDISTRKVLSTLRGHLNFKSAAFDPTGQLLATAGNDGAIRFWDTETWTERIAFDWGFGPMWDVTFSADGLTAACCGMGGRIVVWDVDV
jgi:WD40 repeat protein